MALMKPVLQSEDFDSVVLLGKQVQYFHCIFYFIFKEFVLSFSEGSTIHTHPETQNGFFWARVAAHTVLTIFKGSSEN